MKENERLEATRTSSALPVQQHFYKDFKCKQAKAVTPVLDVVVRTGVKLGNLEL